MKRNVLHSILFTLAALLCVSCGGNGWRNASGVAWGTRYNITYYADRELADSVTAQMRRIELAVSPFVKESNISRINAGETDRMSAEFAELFISSKRLNALSGGAFDPTVAPLIDLWGFGKTRPDTVTPDSATVKDMLQCVGIADCRIDKSVHLIRKDPRTQFDFSAIAKGYGVDAVAEMLERNGCENYMVEIGGEIRVKGHNPREQKWHLQIDDPVKSGISGHEALKVVELTDCSVATSGNYRNLRTLPDGSRVWHTISPVTGYPVASSTLSVTVVAPTCTMADALATACMVLPSQDAVKLVGSQAGVSALFVVDDGRGGTETFVAGPDVFTGAATAEAGAATTAL